MNHDLIKCVESIKDVELREYITDLLNKIPAYFWEVPASSTGKYHPAYALGKGGLVRHTRAAVQIALELFENKTVCNFNDLEKDIIIAALILHDTVKHGIPGGRYTVSNHGMLVEVVAGYDVDSEKENETLATLFKAIRAHMGQWNHDYRSGKKVAPVPLTDLEKFVHLCDYLASRKCLEMNFKYSAV